MDQKTLIVCGTLVTIVFGIFAALISWFAGGNALQGNVREVLRQMVNFQITLFVIGILLSWIPVVGMFIFLAIVIVNVFFAIKAYAAANNNTEIKIPGFDIIK